MSALSPKVCAFFATHHGVASRRRLIELGLAPSQIDRLIRCGLLIAVHAGVYRMAASPDSELGRLVAASSIGDRVSVSHQSAARVWGFRSIGDDRRLHVTVHGPSELRITKVAMHRCHGWWPIDLIERDDGLRLTNRCRTVFDLAWFRPRTAVESMIEQGLHERWFAYDDLVDVLVRLGRRGRNGTARFRAILDDRPAELAAVASGLEKRFEDAILAAGGPQPIRQHPLDVPGLGLIHPDFYWPKAGLIVEVDHTFWHHQKEQTLYDERRDRAVRRTGIEVRRISELSIRHDLRGVASDVLTRLLSA